MDLTRDFQDRGRTVVGDNWFISSHLGKALWTRKTFLFGTIRTNREGNPKDFIQEKIEVSFFLQGIILVEFQEGKSKFAFRQEETLLHFQARKTKQVLLYSTKHHSKEIHRAGKPQMIVDYNSTKFGIDIFDEMCNRYAYKPPVRRWPLRLFMHLSDAAAINAYIICNGNTTRRNFIHELAESLMKSQKELRAETKFWLNEAFVEIAHLFDR